MPDTMVLTLKNDFHARYDGSNTKNRIFMPDTMVLTLKNDFRDKRIKEKSDR